MGTKNNPGKFDCYARAELDEPVFVLLGRDPVASLVVEYWMMLRERLGKTEKEVLGEAETCAVSMQNWAKKKGRQDQLDFVREQCASGLDEAAFRHLHEYFARVLVSSADLLRRVADATVAKDNNKLLELTKEYEDLVSQMKDHNKRLEKNLVENKKKVEAKRNLQALCHRAAEVVSERVLKQRLERGFSRVGPQGQAELDDLVKELRAV